MSKVKWMVVVALGLAALAGGTRLVTAFADPVLTVSAKLSETFLPADGHSTTTFTVTVKLGGIPQANQWVRFGVLGNGDVAFDPAAALTNSSGQATTTVTASTTLGQQSVTATAGSTDDSDVVTLYGTPRAVALQLSPSSITADGASTSTATVTVTDSNGDRVPGQTVTLTSDGSASISPVSTPGRHGFYSATVTASKRAQTETITATVGTLTRQRTLTETAGAPAAVAVALGHGSIVADGASTSTATATVTDANGNPVPGAAVGWSTSDPRTGVSTASGVTDSSGTTVTTITASTRAQTVTVTGAAGGVQGTAGLVETNGPVTGLVLALGSSSMAASGTSTTTATATLSDASGNPVVDGSVDFTTSIPGAAGVTFTPASQVATDADGVATTTITGSATPGAQTVTATAHGTAVTAGAELRLYGSVTSVTLGFTPASLPAGTGGTATATALVTDVAGDPVPERPVDFDTSSDATFCTGCSTTVRTGADGRASIGVNGTADTGPKAFTATTAGRTGQATLVIHGSPSRIALSLAPTTLVADGAGTITATATVTDVAQGAGGTGGNGVPGETVSFTRDGAAAGTGTDNGDGTYTLLLTASTTAQTESVVATDAAITTNPASASASVVETAGRLARLVLSPATASIAPGGRMGYTAAGVDAFGNAIGDVTSATTFSITPDGSCSSAVCSAGTPGLHGVTGTDGGATGTVTLQVTGPDTVTVTPRSHALTANGTSHTTVTALVRNAAGIPVGGAVVTFSNGAGSASSLSFTPASATTDAGGLASTTATSSTRAGGVILTAGEGTASGTAPVTLTGSRFVTAGFSTGRIAADGSSTTTVTAQVVDGSGTPVAGEAVTFDGGGPTGLTVTHPMVVTDAGGNATDEVTASTYGGTQAVTVTDTASDVTADRFSAVVTLTQTATDASFVHAAYQTMLGHDADAPSFSYWLGRLTGGTPRSSLAAALARSPEYRTSIISGTVASGVPDFYQLYLHRAADAGGVQYWVGRMAGIGGPPLSFEQVRLQFVGSREYFTVTNHGDPGTIIDALYHDLLGRTPEPAGRQYWLTHFDVGTIASQFLFSVEGREVLVESYYSSILGRTFDRGGLDYWTQQLLTGASDENIIADFLSSQEYFQSH